MFFIAWLIAAVLGLVAIVHVLWALKIWWPVGHEQGLVQAVVGVPEMTKMPGFLLTMLVVIVLVAAVVCALAGAGLVNLPISSGMLSAALWIIAGVFGLRGVVSYIPLGKLSERVEPFDTLNRRYYSPLCLLLCVGYVVIVLG